jgi:hypothetical protein
MLFCSLPTQNYFLLKIQLIIENNFQSQNVILFFFLEHEGELCIFISEEEMVQSTKATFTQRISLHIESEAGGTLPNRPKI